MSIIDVSAHEPVADEKYLLDCNVLMYMFYPNGDYAADLVAAYSSIFNKIIDAGAELIITDVLISEFINTYTQVEYHRLAKLNKWKSSKTYFKQTFKFSNEYAMLLHEIELIIVRQIMDCFKLVDTKFTKMNFDGFFDKPSKFDFNDRYYGLCMNEYDKSYIVSNDADFSSVTTCDIITQNADLLRIAH